ncbi:MAG: choice-of-anchor D domain-containing protein [Bacteroidia bacterium]|nr:choice-of-anchor D domain-containing protein [Bacteroidia bacterium]
MTKNFTTLICALGLMGLGQAQTLQTGPSTTVSPGMYPTVAGGTMVSILHAGESIGGYTLSGLGDGMGAYEAGGSTFTVLINHEMGNTVGATRAHGSVGAFVSKWVINKSNFQVVSGSDLIQDVKLWTGTTYTTYNATNPSTLAAFARFCSADLPDLTAFYNPNSGKGTQDRIFMNGEETGNEGRGFAHVVTGAEAGVSYQLPHMGRYSYENAVASPFPQDKTIVVGLDDSSPGQVYVYVGNKSYTGSPIEKAGLFGGKLYGISVQGMFNEQTTSVVAANTKFNMIDMSSSALQTGATLNTNSNNNGVTNFNRPEDGAWDPNRPSDFYFVTTASFSTPSRLWRLRFTDITNPELGGTITAVLEGAEGPKMMDNLCLDNHGHVLIQEDPGNQTHTAKVWQYKISTDVVSLINDHDSTRFKVAGPSFLTQDEEASGIIDLQGIKGAGWFLQYDQNHYGLPSPVVEGGQLLAYFNPATAAANPEINLQGNNQSIASGNTVVASSNNTDFGTVNVGVSVSKQFVIQNTNSGTLIVGGLFMSGNNAGDFLISGPTTPFTIAPNGSQTITVYFTAPLNGTRTAILNVMSSDWDEKYYTTSVRGIGASPEINVQGNATNIPSGNTNVNTGDNTNFGTIQLGTSISKTFLIQNTGNGTLTINGLMMSGANSNEFVVLNPPAFPLTLAGNASQNITVEFTPLIAGTRNAQMHIMSDDSDENNYSFAIQGKADIDVSVATYDKDLASIALFPNPSNNEAIVKLQLETSSKVAVNVYDITGALVMQVSEKELGKGEHNISLNTTSLRNGEYFVTLTKDSKLQTLKLVVLH